MSEHKKPRIYIAGPMRGYPEFNFPAFDAAADRFRGWGWDVVNPADLDRQHDGGEPTEATVKPFSHYMRRDISALLGVKAIAFLPGWEKSQGAKVEYTVAKALDLAMYDARTGARLGEPSSLRGPFDPPPAESKDTNPKDAIGILKVPLHLVSGVVKAYDAIAHYLGNVKYGAWNYRACGARASVYIGALHRHIDKWVEGEELDPVDGTPHLANAKACLNILIEGQYDGTLVDDRPPSRDLNPLYERIEGMMANIREKYADKNPRHYTIADTAGKAS